MYYMYYMKQTQKTETASERKARFDEMGRENTQGLIRKDELLDWDEDQ